MLANEKKSSFKNNLVATLIIINAEPKQLKINHFFSKN